MSRRHARPQAARGRGLLPVAANGVPLEGLGGGYTLVPAHYHLTRESLLETVFRVVTVLDVDGREALLLASEWKLTREARRLMRGAGLTSPEREYEPAGIPREAWAAYDRLIPGEWMATTNSPDVFAVRGAMPESLVATLPLLEGEARVVLVPRVATAPLPGRREPDFRLALRDVVRVQELDEAILGLEAKLNSEAVLP